MSLLTTLFESDFINKLSSIKTDKGTIEYSFNDKDDNKIIFTLPDIDINNLLFESKLNCPIEFLEGVQLSFIPYLNISESWKNFILDYFLKWNTSYFPLIKDYHKENEAIKYKNKTSKEIKITFLFTEDGSKIKAMNLYMPISLTIKKHKNVAINHDSITFYKEFIYSSSLKNNKLGFKVSHAKYKKTSEILFKKDLSTSLAKLMGDKFFEIADLEDYTLSSYFSIIEMMNI